MSRVEIHANGRSVVVEHDHLADAEQAARRLWTLAGKAPAPPAGPEHAGSVGFAAALERADAPTYACDAPATVHARPE